MSESNSTQASPQEIKEITRELEQYRERLVNDFLGASRKSKFTKKQALENLANHPEMIKIDEALQALRGSQN